LERGEAIAFCVRYGRGFSTIIFSYGNSDSQQPVELRSDESFFCTTDIGALEAFERLSRLIIIVLSDRGSAALANVVV
jgi:hypothetical protein